MPNRKTQPCVMDGCSKTAKAALGLCWMHYSRKRYGRDLKAPARSRKTPVPRTPDGKKLCRICNEYKSEQEFYKTPSGNPISYCIPCQKTYVAKKRKERLNYGQQDNVLSVSVSN